MTALTFPQNPVIGQLYTTVTGKKYEYDGTKWNTSLSSIATTEDMQDRVSTLFTTGTQSGLTVVYDDDNNKMNFTVNIDGGNASSSF